MRCSTIILPEGANMRSLPKDGIEHRQYLRLKNVVSERQGISTAGGPTGEEGEDMLNFDLSANATRIA